MRTYLEFIQYHTQHRREASPMVVHPPAVQLAWIGGLTGTDGRAHWGGGFRARRGAGVSCFKADSSDSGHKAPNAHYH